MKESVSKPKLPKVWVEFKDGVAWGTYYHRPAQQFRGESEFYQYAPVQKPKVCVWTEDEEYWRIGCNKTTDGPYQIEAHSYCPYCGGKIKVTK